MKPLPSILAAPWAIEPQWLRVVVGVWSRGKIDAPALAKARGEWEARKAERPRLDEPAGAEVPGTGGTLRIVGRVGVLSVEGPLFRHADLFTEISGGTSYDALWRGLEAAKASPQIDKILLRVNSPGGEADGLSELAAYIAQIDKPVWAYADGMCASAAYWLASQADHIVAEETAEVGSIGVRCGILDDSAADEMSGYKQIEIISSVSPGKRSRPIDDEILARVQTRIDDLAAKFVEAVARGRGVDEETVLSDFGQGDVMIAAKAVDAGMVDEIGNFGSTLDALSLAPTTTSSGRSAARARLSMKTETDKPKAEAGGGEWQCAGCNEMMGPSAKAYCAKCSEGDEPDGDEDEDEAKALGIDPKASLGARRARAAALVELEVKVLGLTGAVDHASALARLGDGMKANAEIVKLRADGRKLELRAVLERGLAGASGERPRLSLGIIQNSLHTVLRGAPRKAWQAAMDKVAADADTAKATVSATQVLEAACSVEMTADDLEALADYAKAAPPVAASTMVEPERDHDREAAELDETTQAVVKAAKEARAHFDRNQALATPAK
jgi:ClpP class serine protease